MKTIDTTSLTDNDPKAHYETAYDDVTTVTIAGGFPVHPAANSVPLTDDVTSLASSIKQNGLRLPIVMYRGEIIDGRRRAIACSIIGYKPRIDEMYDPEHPMDEVAILHAVRDLNNRRSLNKAQQAMSAALSVMRFEHKKMSYTVATKYAKEMFDVSAVTYKKARFVLIHEKDTAIQIFQTGYGFEIEGKPESLNAAEKRIKARLAKDNGNKPDYGEAPTEREREQEQEISKLQEENKSIVSRLDKLEATNKFLNKVIGVTTRHVVETPAFLADMDAIGALYKPSTMKDK